MQSDGVIGPNSCGIEPDEIQLSCSSKYHGDTPLILQWRAHGNNQSSTEGQFTVTTNNNEVIFKLRMKSTLDLNNASFICETTRSAKRNYSCSSDAIKISR